MVLKEAMHHHAYTTATMHGCLIGGKAMFCFVLSPRAAVR